MKPREDVMTYNKWLASGHKVRTGERATKVKQFRLFHKSQVEYVGIPPKESAPSEAEVTAVKEAKAASVTQTIVQRLKGKGGNRRNQSGSSHFWLERLVTINPQPGLSSVAAHIL